MMECSGENLGGGKPGISSKKGGFQNGLATRRLAIINRTGKYLRSLTQIENYSTKREPEATIFSIMRGASLHPLII
jgi:hypothetical protein